MDLFKLSELLVSLVFFLPRFLFFFLDFFESLFVLFVSFLAFFFSKRVPEVFADGFLGLHWKDVRCVDSRCQVVSD